MDALAADGRCEVASEDDVATAIELFNVSTLQAARMGDIQLEGQDDGSGKSCEQHINQRVPINATVNRRQLVGDLNAQGLDQAAARQRANKGQPRHCSQPKAPDGTRVSPCARFGSAGQSRDQRPRQAGRLPGDQPGSQAPSGQVSLLAHDRCLMMFW